MSAGRRAIRPWGRSGDRRDDGDDRDRRQDGDRGWVVSGLMVAFLAMSASFMFFTPDIVRETLSGLGWPAHHDLMMGITKTVCVVL
jgi:hypothetical protein